MTRFDWEVIGILVAVFGAVLWISVNSHTVGW